MSRLPSLARDCRHVDRRDERGFDCHAALAVREVRQSPAISWKRDHAALETHIVAVVIEVLRGIGLPESPAQPEGSLKRILLAAWSTFQGKLLKSER